MKEMEIIQTACELCPWGCGMDVFLKDGKIVKVRGTPDHPLNRGVLCPKGAAAPQFVYSENRIRTPLKKKDGDFVPISWDDETRRSDFRRAASEILLLPDPEN